MSLMDDADRAAARRALIESLTAQAVSLAAMLLILWGLAHTADLQHAAWRARQWRDRKTTASEAEYQQFLPSLHRDIRRAESGDCDPAGA